MRNDLKFWIRLCDVFQKASTAVIVFCIFTLIASIDVKVNIVRLIIILVCSIAGATIFLIFRDIIESEIDEDELW